MQELKQHWDRYLSVDVESAYNNLDRNFLRYSLSKYRPDMIPTIEASYGNETILQLHNGLYCSAGLGLKQGCPHSGLAYSISVNHTLEELPRYFNDEIMMTGFIDDGNILIKLQKLQELLKPAGLKLNQRKCMEWKRIYCTWTALWKPSKKTIIETLRKMEDTQSAFHILKDFKKSKNN